jgi:hypothetical protein
MEMASSLGSFGLKEAQSSIEAGQAETAAKSEELRLVQREADRKDRLASALAAQNALAGARGIAAFEGSPLTVLEDSLQRERTASERDRFSTELNVLAGRSTARTRRKMQSIGSRLQLMQEFGDIAKTTGGAFGG